jgi:hypothetical protein
MVCLKPDAPDKNPITKSQVPNKFQLLNHPRMFGHLDLVIDYYLGIGAWIPEIQVQSRT